MLDFEIAHRHQDGNGRSGEKEITEVDGEVVHDHGTHEGPLHPLTVAEQLSLRELYAKHACGGEKHTDKGCSGVGPLPFGGTIRSMSRMPKAKSVSKMMGSDSR